MSEKSLTPDASYSRFDFRRVRGSDRRFFRIGITNWEVSGSKNILVAELRQEYNGYTTVIHRGHPSRRSDPRRKQWGTVDNKAALRGVEWSRVHDSFFMEEACADPLFYKYIYHPSWEPIPLEEDLLVAVRIGLQNIEHWRDKWPHPITQEGPTLRSVLQDVPADWLIGLPRPWGD